jgi:pimeloyl-ACP methyl ester carboxylesterase
VSQFRARFVPWVKHCADSLKALGFDLRGYNTVENARDLEALRIALGAERLSLVGISYGTHLALAYARAYPNRVDRMVLAGTEGVDHTYKLPSTVHRAFARIDSTYVAQTGAPHDMSLGAKFDRLRERLVARPARVQITVAGQPVDIAIGPTELDFLAFGATGSRTTLTQLSAVLDASLSGNFQPLATALFREAQRGARAMLFAMDCASGVSRSRANALRREEGAFRFGAVLNLPFPDVCASVPHTPLGESFRSRVTGHMPVLFISGDLDTRTPLEHAMEVSRGFGKAQHLVIRGASHDNDLLIADPDIGRNIIAFLQGSPVAKEIQLPPLFQRR